MPDAQTSQPSATSRVSDALATILSAWAGASNAHAPIPAVLGDFINATYTLSLSEDTPAAAFTSWSLASQDNLWAKTASCASTLDKKFNDTAASLDKKALITAAIMSIVTAVRFGTGDGWNACHQAAAKNMFDWCSAQDMASQEPSTLVPSSLAKPGDWSVLDGFYHEDEPPSLRNPMQVADMFGAKISMEEWRAGATFKDLTRGLKRAAMSKPE
jgi:hypothetical protein